MSQQRLNLRAQLIRLLLAVQQGQSLAQIQSQYVDRIAVQDRALFHELSLGVLRQWFALKQVTLPLLDKALSDAHIETALYLGIYQILSTRIADHAAISETVTGVKQLGFESASGLVNAVLRRVTRERETLAAQLAEAHGLPSWLYKRLKKDWPDQIADLSQQLKYPAPLSLRIQQRLIGRDAYLLKLQQQQIAARACQYSKVGIVLEQGVSIPELIGYAQGWFSVQDEHAQLAATLLPDLNDQVVLDACAAPGGKTAHLLEQFKPRHLLAMDCDGQRLQRLTENLARLQLLSDRLEIVTADAGSWQADHPLDCILLDAPCTASGVIRRHPDIRLLRQSGDVAATVALQKRILQQLWPQLKVGGQLLYITCSILKDENERQMQQFLAEHSDAQEVALTVDWGMPQLHGRQLLPTQGQGDGFYYCLLQKQA
jgi:16S rRNA (cytosine967-C5)-methyltransferase